jgi:alkanesulfonate monooxygenase SsuD/methylene tetrahydromethanopterin reductase-like flavin-dependent oxidoreductase (luciferase family)
VDRHGDAHEVIVRIEAWSVMKQAFGGGALTHEGRFFAFRDVPIMMQPLQRPHPSESGQKQDGATVQKSGIRYCLWRRGQP